MVKHWAFSISFITLIAGILLAQGKGVALTSGDEVYRSACVTCHGADGRGAPDSLRRFEKPPTFPDFTNCRATVRESDDFWGAIINDGGPGRGFSEIMPSFRDALTSDQIKKVMGHLRTYCREPAWPRGEMNLPRPLVTEKAFPEDEMVMDIAIDAEGDTAIGNEIVYEKRLGPRGQLDVVVPFRFQKPDEKSWESGVGDIVAGYKHVVFSSLKSGSILSFAGEMIFATGNSDRDMGKGVNVFEAFAGYGQLLPKNSFLHFQSGIELPTDTDKANQAVFCRTVLGKTFAQGQGFGRHWSPMVELLADRELATGERINWDIVPQFQVTLSRRQHIRANVGVRLPINDFGPRTTQVLFYLMWDTFDGGIRDGW